MQLDKLTDSVKLNLILKTKDACPMFWMKIYKKNNFGVSEYDENLACSGFAAKWRCTVLDEPGADGGGEAGLGEARVARGHGWQVEEDGRGQKRLQDL